MAASRAVEQVPWGRAWVGPAGAAEALPPLAAALAALAAANALCCAVAAVSYWRPLPAGAPGGVAFDPMGSSPARFGTAPTLILPPPRPLPRAGRKFAQPQGFCMDIFNLSSSTQSWASSF
ncbi:unnamed protein product [Prorocentrum cordatum]|uniref:Uncharacterized protein n=1 Tax=Prorocentrum cordatum TaxID=2364126 RepID=A0ABN9TR70_9DINO|nr:unnamed protein product [Polarella glacialis]